MEIPSEFEPATQSELSRWLADQSRQANRAPVFPVGGRTALGCGAEPTAKGVTVSLHGLERVLDFPSRDQTITVEAGLPWSSLCRVLAEERQRLPVDVAEPSRATVGGAIATNTSGPLRWGAGSFRDYVIGIAAVDVQGRRFQAGGRVVKNVAGYDLCKMLVGSHGALGIITQVTLKVRPQPAASAWLWCTFDRYREIDDALTALNTSGARPVACEVLNPRAAHLLSSESQVDLPVASPVLCLGVEGTEREVVWQIDTLVRELQRFTPRSTETVEGEPFGRLHEGLTEWAIPSDDPVTFRATLRPSGVIEFVQRADDLGVAVQAHAGNGLVNGHLSDTVTSYDRACEQIDQLRALAVSHRGHLTVLHADAEWKRRLDLFGTWPPSVAQMRALKQKLDPQNLLNPGRFFRW